MKISCLCFSFSLLPCISFRFISNLSIVITIFRKRSLFSMLMFMNWELQCKIMWLFVQHNSQQMLLILLVYCIEIYISIYSHRQWKFLLVCRYFFIFSKEFKHFLVQFTLQSWRVSCLSLYCRKLQWDIHYCLWMYCHKNMLWLRHTIFYCFCCCFKGHQR